MKSFKWIGVLLLLSATCLAAAEPVMSEAKMREQFGVPADGQMTYQGEDGASISFAEMMRRMQAGAVVSMIKNPAKHTYTLTLKPMKMAAPAPKLTRLPPIDLPDLAGRRVRSADLTNKPTLVSFFFDECVPCIKEVPILNAFARKHSEYNYLAITFDPKQSAVRFVKKYRLEWPVIADAMSYLDAAHIREFPTYLFVSTAGDVRAQGSGLDSDAMANTDLGLRKFEKWVDDARQAGSGNGWRTLLDATLSQWNVYLSYPGTVMADVVAGKAPATLKPLGLNPAGQNVFTVVQREGKPVLRVSGEIYGCAATRESFSNYQFRAKVKWGEKKWQPRLSEPRDSGILYHGRGAFGVDYWKSWALSQEFQVIEHGLGEYWTIANGAFDIRVDPKAPGAEAPKWNPAAPWKQFAAPDNHALAGSDQDRPGEWNQLELVCFQDDCLHIVNGKVVMALGHARYKDGDKFVPMTGGRLQIQSEAAEVFYKDIEIRSIAALPAEYAGYFK